MGLARGYAAHVVILPLLFFLALSARARLVRRHGWVDAGAPERKTSEHLPFVAGVAGVTALGVLALALFAGRAPLDSPADPMSDYPARPEWFLFTLFEMRKLFHGIGELWGTTLPPLAAAIVLALLPWIDRRGRLGRPSRPPWSSSSRRRPGPRIRGGGARTRIDKTATRNSAPRPDALGGGLQAVRLAMDGARSRRSARDG